MKGGRKALRILGPRIGTSLARIGLALALLAALAAGRAALAQDAEPTAPPAGTADPAAAPTGTAAPREPTATANALEGTVAAIAPQDNTITINTDSGLRTLTIPPGVAVLRNGLPSALAEVEATDRIIVQRGANDRVLSLLTYAAPVTPTAALTPAARATGTAPAAPTPGATPTGPPETGVVSGTVTSIENGLLTVAQDNGETTPVNAANVPGLAVTRDGRTASLEDVRPNDRVEVTYNQSGVPAGITATSTPQSLPAPPGRFQWLLYLLPMLALLVALLLLILSGRRPARGFVMTRRRG